MLSEVKHCGTGLWSLTQVRPLQRFGRQANLEPAFFLVKLCRRQACSIHADGISNVAVSQDGSGIFEGECEALRRVLRGDGGDVGYVFDLRRNVQQSSAFPNVADLPDQ